MSSHKSTDFDRFEDQRDAAVFAAALRPKEFLLQFFCSPVCRLTYQSNLFLVKWFFCKQDGSEAHTSGIIISSGGTHNISTRTDGSIAVLEKSSNRGAEWTIELSHQLQE